MLLKGAEHGYSFQKRLLGSKSRIPVIIDIIMFIKRHLFESTMDISSKIMFWTANTLIWNGSLKLHEALSRLQEEYDPQTTKMFDNI